MRELGFSRNDFHFEPVRIYYPADSETPNYTIQIPAYNEFYYLTSRNVPGNLTILSDTHFFGVSDAQCYPLEDIYCIHEFSGLIQIFRKVNAGVEQPTFPGIDLEFVRAIPEFNPLEERPYHDLRKLFGDVNHQLNQMF